MKNRNIIIGSVVAIAAITGIVLFSKRSKNDSGNNGDSSGDDTGGDNPPIVISDTEARRIADGLHEAMRSIGNDPVKIRALVQPLTEEDFKKVVIQFGTRCYNVVLGNDFACLAPIPPFVNANLFFWISSELGGDDLKFFENKFPNLFKE